MSGGKGTIYYGIHFYPGVVQYNPPEEKPYKLFLDEDVLRSMDQSFAGRPVFVDHVDDVPSEKSKLKNEADGWVIESFFNKNDGKHWAKFIIVSDEGERAIKNGMRLSNSYFPLSFSHGGTWNAIPYDRRLISGQYEHLALVKNPRYNESIVLTCEQFKKYNEEKANEIERIKNNNDDGDNQMALNFWKRTKVDNSTDLEGMCVTLPKSKKEISIVDLINNADEQEIKSREPKIANGEEIVTVDGEKMKISQLIEKYEETLQNDDVSDVSYNPAAMNGPEEGEEWEGEEEEEEEEEKKIHAKKKKKKSAPKMKKEDDEDYEMDMGKKKNAEDKANKLRNSGPTQTVQNEAPMELTTDNIARGKLMYGNKRG